MADQSSHISYKPLTPRQQRFVRETIEHPELPATERAIRSGYSSVSAHTQAYRLLRNPRVQSELAKHFTDAEAEVSAALKALITRLRETIENSKSTNAYLRAGKLLVDYTRLSAGVLGLEVKVKREVQEAEGPDIDNLSPEELIEQHRAEIAKLEELSLRRSESQGVKGSAN